MGALCAVAEEERGDFGEPCSIEDEWDETEEGGDLREEDSAEAREAAALYGFADGYAFFAEMIDFIDQDERVIHDDTADGEHAKAAHDAERQTVEEMTNDGTDDAEGHDKQHNEGLRVTAKRNGHEPVHGSEHEQQ